MALQTGLEGRPWYVGAGVGLGVGVVLFVIGHVALFRQMRADIEAREGRLAQLQTRIQEGRAASQKLPQFREEVQRLQAELDQLLRILPSRRNTADLLRRVRDLTQQGEFNLLRFTPGSFAEKDFYSEWPIAISLEGGYHNLAILLDRISRLSRIINVEDLRIAALKEQQAARTVSASFNAVTFVYKEPEEEAAPPVADRPARGAAQGATTGATR